MEISINGIQMIISDEELEKILKKSCIEWNMYPTNLATSTLLLYIEEVRRKKQQPTLSKSVVENSKELLKIPDVELNSFEILVKKILILENELYSLSKVLVEKWYQTQKNLSK